MSAGICIMNKDAIALAADSAITIGNHVAIHNSANKLFMISNYQPVGVIIYSNSCFMQVSMELILKEFKKTIGQKSFPNLVEYFEEFIGYLESNISLFRFKENEEKYVLSIFDSFLKALNNDYNKMIQDKINIVDRKITEDELTDIQNQLLNLAYDFIKNKKIKETNRTNYIRNKYLLKVKNSIQGLFKWIDKEKLDDLSNRICSLVDSNFLDFSYVGFALAGYGLNDIYPTMAHYKLYGYFDGKIIYSQKSISKIDENNPCFVEPLAQVDVMQTFLYGINDTLIADCANDILNELDQKVSKMSKEYFTEGSKTKVTDELKKSAGNIVNKIIENANRKYMFPILNSVTTLPIEEMALLAESMINITSLRRKVALDGNIGTVGGPIDVAVITKSDGFVWLKRKLYFDIDLNPQFSLTHYCKENEKNE